MTSVIATPPMEPGVKPGDIGDRRRRNVSYLIICVVKVPLRIDAKLTQTAKQSGGRCCDRIRQCTDNRCQWRNLVIDITKITGPAKLLAGEEIGVAAGPKPNCNPAYQKAPLICSVRLLVGTERLVAP